MGRYDRNRDDEGRFTGGSRGDPRWRDDDDFGRQNYGRSQQPPRDDRGRFMSEGETGDYYGNGRNEDGFGIGDDNTYHGTFVATTAAARGNNGFGVVGAAWTSSIMPIKVFTDDGSASIFHIAAAFTYAADNGADVVNASLTLGQSTATLREAVDYARARDCVLVAAAGNFNSPSPLYPAAHDGVLAVGARAVVRHGLPQQFQ